VYTDKDEGLEMHIFIDEISSNNNTTNTSMQIPVTHYLPGHPYYPMLHPGDWFPHNLQHKTGAMITRALATDMEAKPKPERPAERHKADHVQITCCSRPSLRIRACWRGQEER